MPSLPTKEPLNTGTKGKMPGDCVDKGYWALLVLSVLWGREFTNNNMTESATQWLERC